MQLKKQEKGLVPDDTLVQSIIEGIKDKKGKEITVIDLSAIHSSICDSFIICHGDSTTQVRAIADGIDARVKSTVGLNPRHIEGLNNALWVLLDYGDAVVHVFLKEIRDLFKLEELWGDAPLKTISDGF